MYTTTERNYKTVEAQYLKVGDYLPWTEATVTVAPSAGIRTPSGKIDLVVRNKKGIELSKTWNKRTKITVKREALETKATTVIMGGNEYKTIQGESPVTQ